MCSAELRLGYGHYKLENKNSISVVRINIQKARDEAI